MRAKFKIKKKRTKFSISFKILSTMKTLKLKARPTMTWSDLTKSFEDMTANPKRILSTNNKPIILMSKRLIKFLSFSYTKNPSKRQNKIKAN